MFGYFDDVFNTYWDSDDNFLLNNKRKRTKDMVLYMLDRTQEIFNWEGLPKTIPAHNLETLLQIHGDVCITDVPEKGLYAFFGGLGGELNAYYEPTIYTIANPYLQFNAELQIGVDCVRARNDKYSNGLLPLFSKYCSMMNENEISMNMLSICYRIDNLISADDDRTFESAKQFFNDIVSGQFGAISSSEFFDGIRNDKTNSSGHTIKDLIEYEQYLKASAFNEIGLNSNYNMKRERMVASESEMNDDALIPLVSNMYKWRLKLIEDMRELYGDKYDLSKLNVTLNPIWDLDKMYAGIIPETDEQETPETDEQETDEQETPETVEQETTEEEKEIETDEETGEPDINIEINIENTNGGETDVDTEKID